ncbi:hypothetical protein Zm00014a_036731 [Zea mays]|uniref:Uncharacterized protein n=1 Tax=Zea mays TaxID=4577 RepID=A0A3L6EZZ4_MAIZE|nr:hypothetical protein Zm00014a_036731 [Zea mays]
MIFFISHYLSKPSCKSISYN